jgi:hypothetical protein
VRPLRCLCACVVLPLLAAPAGAQDPLAQLRPGVRVRITAVGIQPRRLVGEVASIDGDSLRIIRTPGATPTVLPRTALIGVERSQGKHRSAGRGAWMGAAAGVGVGVLCAFACPAPEGSGTNMAPASGLIFGTLGGAVVGALVPRERWRQLPLFDDAPPGGGSARR